MLNAASIRCVSGLVLAFGSAAFAQPCEPGFASGEPGESGIFDSFSAYVQPMTEYQGKLIIGGAFSSAGPLATKCVAAFDRASGQWSRLGRGVDTGNTNGYAAALATYTIDGVEHLVMGGGYFGVRNANNQLVANTTGISAWNGTARRRPHRRFDRERHRVLRRRDVVEHRRPEQHRHRRHFLAHGLLQRDLQRPALHRRAIRKRQRRLGAEHRALERHRLAAPGRPGQRRSGVGRLFAPRL
jgi:hypothetical protein